MEIHAHPVLKQNYPLVLIHLFCAVVLCLVLLVELILSRLMYFSHYLTLKAHTFGLISQVFLLYFIQLLD